MPYRIALVGLLVVGVLYLLVLKPKDEEVVPAAAPAAVPAVTQPATTATTGGNGITGAGGRAQGAAATQTAADAATAKAADAASETPSTTTATPGATAATPSATTAGTPAATAGTPAVAAPDRDPSAPILAELERGHTPVILFTNADAADDRAVRRALRRIDTRGGKVDVHVVSIKRVGEYEAITSGVQVTQSPTLLVIGRQKTASRIVGFTTTAEIDQLVGDVRRR